MTIVAMPSMRLTELMPEAFSADYDSLEIRALVSDSRKATSDSLYFAVKSQSSNDRDYVLNAIDSGAVAIATDDEQVAEQAWPVPVCFDSGMSKKLSSVASAFYHHPSHVISVIGITGTNGKTSCCFWLSWLMNQAGIQCGQIGTLGFSAGGFDSGIESGLKSTGFTTPDPIQTQQLLAECREAEARAVVMEVSSHGLDQGRVEAVKFQSAIFTNLSQDHLDYHGTMANYLDAKLKLFKRTELCHAVINLDDPYSDCFFNALSPDVKVHSYSLTNKDANLYFSDIRAVAEGYKLQLNFSDRQTSSTEQSAKLLIPVFGEYNLANLLAVSAVVLANAISFEKLVELLQQVPGVPGRLERVNVPQVQSTSSERLPNVLVDFAHTPDAVRSVLSSLRLQVSGKLIAVLGCGGDRDKLKRPLMAKAAKESSDVQIFTSDNPRNESPERILQDMLEGLADSERKAVLVIEDRHEAITKAIGIADKGDLVAVLGRGHETHQLIMGEKQPFNDADVCRERLQQKAIFIDTAPKNTKGGDQS